MKKFGLLVLFLAVILAYQDISSVNAQTTSQRLNQLEKKTDYYNKKNKTFRRTKLANSFCYTPDIEIPTDWATGGTLYYWVKAKITYSTVTGASLPGTIVADLSAVDYSRTQRFGLDSKDTRVSQNTGVIEITQSGAWLYVGPNFMFSYSAYDEHSGLCIDKIELELKTTFIEVPEPQ